MNWTTSDGGLVQGEGPYISKGPQGLLARSL